MADSTDLILDNSKPIFMFSGQGSQKVGMGNDLADEPLAQEVFECASDIFGFDVQNTMATGPEETLNDTRYAQAAIIALSLALERILKEKEQVPSAVLGFSLGQIAALHASGMLSLEETFSLAHFRSQVMADAAEHNKGAMCALLGADEKAAQELCDGASQGEVLVAANFNCPGQIVISGSLDAIKRAQQMWTEQKKRSALLATSGAFHSPLMQQAADELYKYLNKMAFKEPQVPLICNLDAKALSAANAAEHLSLHLTHPVRFHQSAQYLLEAGANTYIEVGFGGVLLGLMKRIDKSTNRILIDSKASLDSFME